MSVFESEMNSLNDENTKKDLHVEQIDINTSLSSLTSTTISLDSILKKCGDLGRFQLIHFLLINLIAMGAATAGFYYVFGAADLDHRCRLPADIWPHDTQYSPGNLTYKAVIDLYVPKTKDDKWEKCRRRLTGDPDSTIVDCPNGWVYDRTVFGYTFTEEANLVCSAEPQKSWLATLMQCGGFSLLIIGSLGDRYGRKKTTAFFTILLFVTCIITQSLMQWLPMTVKIKFYLMLLNQFASGLTASTFSLIFILLLELTSSAHTGFAGNVTLVSFTIGEAIVTLFAYLAKDWQILKWLNTAFIGLVLPYLYFMPESPLFMYSKRQYAQLELLLRRIAKTNRRKESDWYPFYQDFIRNQPVALSRERDGGSCEKVRQLLTHRPTVVKLLIVALLGFTTLMLYIKISYGLAAIDISPYLGILIGAVVEAAGYMAGSFLISTRLGRKGAFILTMVFTIACVVLIPIITVRSSKATVYIAQFGKFSISGAIAVSWIFVPELFSTSIRSSANGFFIAFSRMGAIVAPIINTSVKTEYLPYTFYGSAGLAVLVVLLSLILPETKDKSMDSAEDYATNRSNA